MAETYDVIIVGAGPAGVSASLHCTQEGLSVLLVDQKEKQMIGDKVCGEAISKKTVTQISEKLKINPPLKEEINTDIKELVLRTATSVDYISFPAIGYMIDRHKYGQRLLSEAIERGAVLKSKTKVIKPIIKEGKISGVIVKNQEGKEEEFFSKIVIDCSGVLSTIRTKLPDDFEPLLNKKLTKLDYASCYREIIELNEPHNLDGKIVLQYEKNIPEPGYIWFFADGKNKLNCGTGFIKSGENAKKSVKSVYFITFEKYYSKGTYTVLDGRGGSIPFKPPLWNAVAPGLLIAGDAAFHVDPLTAEGHGPAMTAGYIAGEVANQAIRENKFNTKDLWGYNSRIFSEFGAEHARSRILAMVLERIGSDNLDFLLKRQVIKRKDLTSEGILKKQTISMLIERFIRILPRFDLLITIMKSIKANKKIEELCNNYPEEITDFLEWKEEIEKVYAKF
jgi:digeranylgeranylglycerophospholipid reductase